jgi:hypothetical protein
VNCATKQLLVTEASIKIRQVFSFERRRRTIYAVSNPKGTYGNAGYSFR